MNQPRICFKPERGRGGVLSRDDRSQDIRATNWNTANCPVDKEWKSQVLLRCVLLCCWQFKSQVNTMHWEEFEIKCRKNIRPNVIIYFLPLFLNLPLLCWQKFEHQVCPWFDATYGSILRHFKKIETVWACSTDEEVERCIQEFGRES